MPQLSMPCLSPTLPAPIIRFAKKAKGKGRSRLEVLVEELVGIACATVLGVCTQEISRILDEKCKPPKFLGEQSFRSKVLAIG